MLSAKAQNAADKVIGLMVAGQSFRTKLRQVRIKEQTLSEGQRGADNRGTMFSETDYRNQLSKDLLDLAALADKVRELAGDISDHDRAYVLSDQQGIRGGLNIGAIIRREESQVASVGL